MTDYKKISCFHGIAKSGIVDVLIYYDIDFIFTEVEGYTFKQAFQLWVNGDLPQDAEDLIEGFHWIVKRRLGHSKLIKPDEDTSLMEQYFNLMDIDT